MVLDLEDGLSTAELGNFFVQSSGKKRALQARGLIGFRGGGGIMRDSIKKAIGSTVQDLLNAGVITKTSFTEKELNALDIKIPEVQLTTTQIKAIRKQMNLSQTVFAKLLNVSPSSIRQWEQGKREPGGSTKVLLELLKRIPHLLDYRLTAQ